MSLSVNFMPILFYDKLYTLENTVLTFTKALLILQACLCKFLNYSFKVTAGAHSAWPAMDWQNKIIFKTYTIF